MIDIVESIKHPLVILARNLTTAVGRKQHKKCLIFSQELVELAQNAGASIQVIFYDPRQENRAWIQEKELQGIRCLKTSQSILKKISDTSYIIPVIAIADMPEPREIKSNFVLMLDRVIDHGNIGTIMRTARAFGITDFVTTQQTDFYYKKIIEASRGLVFGTNIQEKSSSTEALISVREMGYYIVATSPTGSPLQSMSSLPPQPICLVVGNETAGISKEILDDADLIVQIPMISGVESLNVGVFAGISVYELKLKQVLTMLNELIQMSVGRDLGIAMRLSRAVFDQELAKVSSLS